MRVSASRSAGRGAFILTHCSKSIWWRMRSFLVRLVESSFCGRNRAYLVAARESRVWVMMTTVSVSPTQPPALEGFDTAR